MNSRHERCPVVECRGRRNVRRDRWQTVAAVMVAVVLAAAAAGAGDQCCSCGYDEVVTYGSGDGLPCLFDHPAGWEEVFGDDGAAVHGAASKSPCGAQCAAPQAITFSLAKKPNPNAETSEEIWRQVMKVVGTARCGDRVVTFFALPGADPHGLTGGVRFHVGAGGEAYGGNATFSCSEPGGWLELQQLFVDSFRTNPETTFPER